MICGKGRKRGESTRERGCHCGTVHVGSGRGGYHVFMEVSRGCSGLMNVPRGS